MTTDLPSALRVMLDTVLPMTYVVATTRAFLAECGWCLEIDEDVITIPDTTEIVVRSRKWVNGDVQDVFLQDHFEAEVLIGAERHGRNVQAAHGVLILYFNRAGEFVSEDRYNRFA